MDAFHVENIGYIPVKREAIRARFPFEAVVMVLQGSGFFRIDQGPIRRLQAPAIFYLWPGPLFHYGPQPGSSWEERWLCLTGSRVKDWVRWGWLPRTDRPMRLLEPVTVVQTHRRIFRAFPPCNEFPLDQAKIEIEQLVYQLGRAIDCRPSRAPDKLATLIQRWIKDPQSARDLRTTASELGMSYSHFRQQFTRRTELTPHQFLLRLRIDRACLRLAQSDDPVKTIARDCGFTFVESFNRAFRQVKRMTPREYRRRSTLPIR